MAALPSLLRVEDVPLTPPRSAPRGRDQSEVVVRGLAGVADEEVGRDEAFGPLKLAVPSLDLACDCAVPEIAIWRLGEPAEPHAAKGHAVAVAELDRAPVLERRLLVERELCLESRIAARNVFERAVDSIRTEAGHERRPRSGQPEPHAVRAG